MGAFRVGLTGALGSGKSFAAREFGRLGARVVCADAIARDLSRSGRPLARRILRAFGRGASGARGTIDRGRLAGIVFRNPAKLRKLERILHPAVIAEMKRRMAGARRGIVVCDVPLLFEKGLASLFDATAAVSCPPRLALSRAARRDGASPSLLRARMRAQWAGARKAAMADVVIDNSGSKPRFRSLLREYWAAFDRIARTKWRT